MTNRKGAWGCTYSGRKYWPECPVPADIDIQDIAHALSLQCRFGGHTREFYSVAQHAVHVSTICKPENALWGLLHDASEAYIVDIPRPLKVAPDMTGYSRLEIRMMRAVCERFGLPDRMPQDVAEADEILLATEARDLMPHEGEARVPVWQLRHPPAPFPIECWTPEQAKARFLVRFNQLTESEAAA